MSSGWYRNHHDAAVGPFSLEELAYLAAHDKLSTNDLVRSSEIGPWLKAGDIPGLFLAPNQNRGSKEALQCAALTGTSRPLSTELSSAAEQIPPEQVSPPRMPRSATQPNSSKLRLTQILAATGALLFAILLMFALSMHRSESDAAAHFAGIEDSGKPQSAHSQTSTAASDGSRPVEVGKRATKAEAATGSPNTSKSVAIPSAEPPSVSAEPPRSATINESKSVLADLFTLRPQTTVNAANQPAMRDSLKGRTPEMRKKLLKSEGGTAETEAAVERGLKWLVAHQHDDGHWSLDRFAAARVCHGDCTAGGPRSDTAATALALLPFLGAGETHQHGKYQSVVQQGIAWLVNDQQGDGSFGSIGVGNFYAHGMATIALCELLAMTGDVKVKAHAQRAVSYIVEAQDQQGGGWRYQPRQPGDLSVTGWQIMALRSAQIGELHVPQPTMDDAITFLDSVQSNLNGSTYGYTDSFGATPTRTAVGLLCRQYTGWNRQHPGLIQGVQFLLGQLPNENTGDMYYWYNATQVMHHAGGKAWQRWNDVMREILVRTQERKGHAAGSWAPKHQYDHSGGRLYMTALAICTLEVYYRHLPLFRTQAVN